jgi:signal transduction histidine kinase/CheY-like chemotaxis protein/sugar lactone lactonase YvrE
LAILAASAVIGYAAERYVFEVFGVDQGLGNLIVTALRQDRDGYLWVGTENGLYRYDGHRFKRFSVNEGLPSAEITGLQEGPDGSLWVGTTKGLAQRDGIRFRTAGDESLKGTIAFAQGVAFDGKGSIYLATNRGLHRAQVPANTQDLKLELLPRAPGVSGDRVISVYIEPGGAIWYGCALSVCRLENGSLTVWGEKDGVPADQWQAIAKDAAGNLWARGRQMLIELAAGARQFQAVSPADVGPISYGYPSLAFDGRGALLVPTNNGLAMHTAAGWTRVGARQGLPGSTVTSVLLDHKGEVWVGSTGGLARWAGYGQLQSFTDSEGMASGGSLALVEDAAGGIWAGSGGGLSHGVYKNGLWSWQTVGDRSFIWVANLARAKDGAIWATTVESQLVRIDPRTGAAQRFGHFDGAPYSIFIDSADNLWVARTYALYRGKASAPQAGFEPVSLPDANSKTVYLRVIEDAHGDVWVSTLTGVYRFSNGNWQHLAKSTGLSYDAIGNVFPRPNGDLYVTYRGEPVWDRVYREGDRIQVEHQPRPSELAGDNVYSVRHDRSGRMWVLTDHGAVVRDAGRWNRFDQTTGLLRNDCNTFMEASDGSIWIGTEMGLTRFPASGLMGAAAPPQLGPVTFSDVRLGDLDLDPKSPLVEPQPGAVAIHFTTLDLEHGPRTQYRYRCLGLDNRWVETTRPELRDDFMRPGKYRLEVQARQPDGSWGSSSSLAFEVLPRWFEARWFQALIVAIICGALWQAWKARARHFAAQRARLQSEVDARTYELSAANLRLRSEMAERETAAAEKQRLEEELLQARKLESIGRLAGGVAHDFNNLLTVINGHCELLMGKLHEFDPVRGSIMEVRGAGQRAAELTQRLLAFSRKQMLQPRTISLVDTVKGIEAMLRRLVRADINLITSTRPDAGLVLADRVQIEQALINLVVNACDAIEGAGRIVIGLQPAEILPGAPLPDPDLRPGKYVLLSVSDSGCGMDEETLKHVFEPFFTTKDVGKGTGLGLAMVHGLVKQSGGSIIAQSTPGRGTTFRIYLPRVAEAAPAVGSLPAPSQDLCAKGHESILLVEDQEQVRELAVTVLRHAGYLVDNAADGESALMLVEQRQGPLDLLLTDVVMPVMSGPELATKVRHRSPTTRVLYISGYSAESLNQEGVSGEGALHLSKPFTPAQLLEQVRKALDTV